MIILRNQQTSVMKQKMVKKWKREGSRRRKKNKTERTGRENKGREGNVFLWETTNFYPQPCS